MRDWLLTFHILGAAAWIGGGLYSWYSFTQLAKVPEIAGKSLGALAGTADRYFGPAATLTLATGVTLVLTQDEWGWGDTFVIVGLGVFLASALSQALVSSKVQKRMLSAADSGTGLAQAMTGFHRSTAVEVAILLVAVWAMVVKLGT